MTIRIFYFIIVRMETKLTLKLDLDIINKAKLYAKKHRKSLSKIIENYLHFLLEEKQVENKKITPLVKELSGIISLPEEFNYKDNYINYLTKKYNHD